MKIRSSTPVHPVPRKTRAKPTREAVLEAVRRAVKAAGDKPVSQADFLSSSGMKESDLFRYFPRWTEVVRAAGFDFKFANTPVKSDQLLADWGAVARKLRRIPSRKEYQLEGNHGTATIHLRFGGWSNVPDTFRAFARKKPEWADVRELVSTCPKPAPGKQISKMPPGLPKSRWPTRRSWARRKYQLPLYGVPLDFGLLRYAPANEDGVILLFGSMAERLGFLVETVHAAFPDCKAVRKAGPSTWESVRIEFEFESRNFRMHRHDPEKCDLIVCWEHNWPECPVEVLALKDELEKMKSAA